MACLLPGLGGKLFADTGRRCWTTAHPYRERAHGPQGRGCTGDGRQRRARAAHLSRAGEGGGAYRRHVCPEPRRGGGCRPRADIEISDQRRGLRLRHHRRRGRGAAGRRSDQALRPSRHPRQRRRLQQGDPVRRPRQPDDGGVGQDHRRQPDRADASYQGGGARHEGSGPGPHRQHLIRGGARAYGLVHRLCGVEGGPHPPHALHGGGLGARDAGQLRGAGPAGGHAGDRQPAARA